MIARLPTSVDAKRIGLAWSVQEVERLAPQPWDMPMDMIVTERNFLELSRNDRMSDEP